ncbi:MAG TPA: hypothetical protein VGE38_16955 [Nocardioides sp.]|uniref:hypothetical protein n=1 Tax=Nocardioides sp. TaxID=35761 RepID=UPI002ED89D2F
MTPQVFGSPMPWLSDWSRRPLTGGSSKRSLYLGAVGEDFLARGVQAALGPAKAAGALLGARARARVLGDFDMIIHVNGGSEDHVMVVDAKNRSSSQVAQVDVDKAHQRLEELVRSGGLGETVRGARNGWDGVKLSYHLVFAGEVTTDEWQRDARTKRVLRQHHPRSDVHDDEYTVVVESYETLFGDVLCRAMRSSDADSRSTRHGTHILDKIAEQYFPDEPPTPFKSIMERNNAVDWICIHPACPTPQGKGHLLAHLHDQAHVRDAPSGSRWGRTAIESLAKTGACGAPEWDSLVKIDELWEWESGSAAAALLFGPSHRPYEEDLHYVGPPA